MKGVVCEVFARLYIILASFNWDYFWINIFGKLFNLSFKAVDKFWNVSQFTCPQNIQFLPKKWLQLQTKQNVYREKFYSSTYIWNHIGPLSPNPKWSNALKQFVGETAGELFKCVRPFCGVGILKSFPMAMKILFVSIKLMVTLDWFFYFSLQIFQW